MFHSSFPGPVDLPSLPVGLTRFAPPLLRPHGQPQTALPIRLPCVTGGWVLGAGWRVGQVTEVMLVSTAVTVSAVTQHAYV